MDLPEEEPTCQAFGKAVGEEADPWKAVAQLHEPSRHEPVAIIGYQLPDVLPDEALKVPQELFHAKAINETNLQILLTPEFWVTNLLIGKHIAVSFGKDNILILADHFDALTTTLGPCEQIWLLFPPTVKNLQYMQNGDRRR